MLEDLINIIAQGSLGDPNSEIGYQLSIVNESHYQLIVEDTEGSSIYFDKNGDGDLDAVIIGNFGEDSVYGDVSQIPNINSGNYESQGDASQFNSEYESLVRRILDDSDQ